MKLLFDENLSPKLPDRLSDIFPNSLHVRDVGMKATIDPIVWDYAKDNEMNYRLKLQRIDKLKVWLDGFRPFDSTLVAELKKLYDVRFTYNSNAIEGNTLTQSETELVLTKGI